MMALTKDFKDTIQARAQRDPAFRKALLLADVVEGVKFEDGERVEDHSQGTTEAAVHHI